MNYRFDLDEWLHRFPLDSNSERYSGEAITSPWDICNNELLRREMQDQYVWGPPVPVDVFVMAEGEPPDRFVTKIGGLPYRPARAEWPRAQNGRPLEFLAQFNFRDSRDITGPLPGDILLVFADCSSGTIEGLGFEWQQVDLSDIVSAAAIPTQTDTFLPCYGHIFRTVSYPGATRTVPRKKQEYPTCRGKSVWSDYYLRQYQATQIGSAPFFIQGDPQLPGRILCTISSVQPDQHKAFPWVNHPAPLMPEHEWDFENNCLMIGDLGCIYISMDEDHQIYWSESCF